MSQIQHPSPMSSDQDHFGLWCRWHLAVPVASPLHGFFLSIDKVLNPCLRRDSRQSRSCWRFCSSAGRYWICRFSDSMAMGTIVLVGRNVSRWTGWCKRAFFDACVCGGRFVTHRCRWVEECRWVYFHLSGKRCVEDLCLGLSSGCNTVILKFWDLFDNSWNEGETSSGNFILYVSRIFWLDMSCLYSIRWEITRNND